MVNCCSRKEISLGKTSVTSGAVESIKANAKKNIVRVLAENGEIHFVLREHIVDEDPTECVRLKDAEVAKVLRKEASKPLLLLRAE